MSEVLRMRPGWRSATLQDLVFFQRGYDITKAEQKPGDIPVVSSSGINSYHSESKVDGPGVVIGRKGSLGTVHYVEGAYWPHDTTLWSKDLKGNHSRFVYYFLHTLDLERYDVGNSNPTLNRNHIHRLDITIPEYRIQERIADILSAYDDLIENNRRRIQLLEQAARLLYREWFVHLRFPGHEHVAITDGVPEGWEKKQVKDVLEKVKRPRKIKKSEFLKEGLIPCVDQSRDFIGGYTDDEEAVVDMGQPVIVFGDHTRILKFVDFPFACGADGTQLIVSNDETMSQEFLYFALDAIDLSNYFYARHFKFLKDQYIPRPPNMLLSQFTDNAQPILEQIKSLRDHCHHLSKARDLLLPRLMNGEVAV
jgi:type I restriction enzyme S subunit